MPKIEQTIADVNVRAHTFKFITPAESEAMKIPNACNSVSYRQDNGLGDRGVERLAGPIALAYGGPDADAINDKFHLS